MLCPYCGKKSKVTNSRPNNLNLSVWRRRFCNSCKNTWTTREQLDTSLTHKVSFSAKPSEPFQRDVLLFSIQDSMQHRINSYTDASELTDTVLAKVMSLKIAIIPADTIRSVVHATLNNFDAIAAAVYKAKYPS